MEGNYMNVIVDLKIFIIIIIFSIARNINTYTMLIVFGIIHELGHLICGLIMGFKPKQIGISPFGLSLSFKINYNDYNKKIFHGSLVNVKRIVLALAGPLTNMIIICLLSIWLKLKSLNINIITNIIYSNLIIAIFNLIPIYPMDGGKIVKDVSHIFKGLQKSYTITKAVTWTSLSTLTAICSLLIYYYKNVVILIVVAYLWIIAIKTQKQINMKEKIFKVVNSIKA